MDCEITKTQLSVEDQKLADTKACFKAIDDDPLCGFSPPKEPKTARQKQAWALEHGTYPQHVLSVEQYELRMEWDASKERHRRRREEGFPSVFDLITDPESWVLGGYTLPPDLETSRDIEYIMEEVRKECDRVLEVRSKGEETEGWSTRPKPKPAEIVEIDLITL
jgi:hypothetical protein